MNNILNLLTYLNIPVPLEDSHTKQEIRKRFLQPIPLHRSSPPSASRSQLHQSLTTDVLRGCLVVKLISYRGRMIYLMEHNSDPELLRHHQVNSSCDTSAQSWSMNDVLSKIGQPVKIINVHKNEYRYHKTNEFFHLKYGIERLRGLREDLFQEWEEQVMKDVVRMMKSNKSEKFRTYLKNFMKWMNLSDDFRGGKKMHTYIHDQINVLIQNLRKCIYSTSSNPPNNTPPQTSRSSTISNKKYHKDTILIILQFIVFCACARSLLDLIKDSREGERIVVKAGVLDIMTMESILVHIGGKIIFQSPVDLTGCTDISRLVDVRFFNFPSSLIDSHHVSRYSSTG